MNDIMIAWIIQKDKNITFFLKSFFPQNHFFDVIFSFLSIKGASFFVWIIIIFLAIFLEEKKNPGISKKDKKFIFLFLVSFILTSILVAFPLKNLFQRPRPQPVSPNFQFQQVSTRSCPKDFSFPSGHAATAFASATVLAAFDKKRKWFYFLVAGLIALSRIYLGCHYFLDTVAGGVIGYAISQFIFITNPIEIFFRRRRRY